MRTDSYSALDFMYWVLENVEENYTRVEDAAIFLPAADASLMQTVIVEASLVCGVETPRTFSALLAKADRYLTLITPERAFRKRGAVLYKGTNLHVSLGDEKRLVGIDTGDRVSIYSLGVNDREPSYWDGAFLLPELRYM